MGGAALVLRFARWWEAAVLAGVAIAVNAHVLPRLPGWSLYRDAGRGRRYLSGVTLYPLAILLLVLVLPERLDIVASAWAILAFGDGMATIVGRRVGGPRIPWNRAKSVSGTAAFLVFGGIGGVLLCLWCRPVILPPPYVWYSIAAPLLATVAAAAVETIPVRLDDNVSVPAIAAAVLWWASLISADSVAAFATMSTRLLLVTIGVNGAVSIAGYVAGMLTISGALAGEILGLIIVLTAGWRGWTLLLATFVMAVVTSQIGLRHKLRLGIAEGRGGRRGGGNAVANTGVAAAAAMLAALSYAPGPALVGFVAALAAAGSDTMASEIGKAWSGPTVLFPAFRRVPAGTSGAVSLVGTVAGLLGAGVLGAIAAGTRLIAWGALGPVVAGATIGAFAESALGATLEERGVLNNDILNLLNTAIAAAAAVLIAKSLN
ncbi:MAG: hypothetical protein V7647_1080 [Acidobacteriota bacterium]|jgi:uncharacterized protein (TIGR00297 family)